MGKEYRNHVGDGKGEDESMNENGTKRREWVKTAAIVFLSVLLVLTFFSNTFMNYSLPEVAAQYVQSGSITAKIRGTGVVESGDPYNIMIKETRKVASVAVKVGDVVQQGDVLVYLEDSDSTELEGARTELEAAQAAYETELLKADVNAGVIQGLNSNTSTGSYRQQITDAQRAVEEAQKKVDEWTAKHKAFDIQISITPTNNADVSKENKAFNDAKTAKENADFALQNAKNRVSALEAQLEYENSISGGNLSNTIKDLEDQLLQAQQVEISAQTAANNAQLAYDVAKTALDNKTAAGDTTGTIASLKLQQNAVKIELDKATATLEEKTKALETLTGNINKTLSLETLYSAVTKAQEKLNEQLEKSVGAVITAEISGTIITINASAGKEVTAADPVVVMQPEGKGYSMSFSVTNQQATRLSVGDMAELVNSWRYDDVTIQLASIRPDTTDPGQKKLLTFDVSGEVTPGQSLNVSVGQRSANYDMIVPNSAIREDNNGKFVLTVQSKSTPLGNRYTAVRADVEVLASDDTQSAVSGALYNYDFVITTSTKPVEAGQLVRLSDSSGY